MRWRLALMKVVRLYNILTHPESHLTCIDTFQNSYAYQYFCQNTNAHKNKITVYKERSDKALRTLHNEVFDFIYVDGSHFAVDVLTDAILGFLLLRSGGIMFFDDYPYKDYFARDSVKTGIDAFLSVFYGRYTIICFYMNE